MDTKILEELGLSKGEVKVYFALLELGESSIGPVAKKSGVTVSKIYIILEKLAKKGLSSYVIKSGTKYFNASSPKKIIEYLNEKKKKIDKEKNEIYKILPFIENKQKIAKEIQTAEVYQTFDGLRTLYNEIIEFLKENKEDFIAFSLGEKEYQYKESEYFFQEYDTKRRNYDIKIKLLSHIRQKKFLNTITKHDSNIKVKYLPFKLPTGVIIFGNSIATLVWGEVPTAFVIRSKAVAEAYFHFFWDMWKIAK